jgi:hypothetical protein
MNQVQAVDGRKSLKKKTNQPYVVEDEIDIEENDVFGTNIAFEAQLIDDVNASSKGKKKKKKKKKVLAEDDEQVQAAPEQ